MPKTQIVDKIIAYETGKMNTQEEIIFFQMLIDMGLAQRLQGSAGQRAKELVRIGKCNI